VIAIALLLLQQSASAAPSHWQQEVDYQITARLDEPSGVLSGTQRIHYYNHSPDTLTTFSLHLFLNAFRPGSRWAAGDSAEGRRRFNDLRDPDYAFNHVRNVMIMGTPVQPVYPFAPDSTVVRFTLPRPLLPGDSIALEMDWDARPSTTPRRQGRQGRRFDFAQWYPKVVVYDRYGWQERPLYPAGACPYAAIRAGNGPTAGRLRSNTSAITTGSAPLRQTGAAGRPPGERESAGMPRTFITSPSR
jgi:hypothetical protein